MGGHTDDMFRVEVPKYIWKKQKVYRKNAEICAFDTETINGYCRLITDSYGKFAFTKSFEDCADFIMDEKHQGKRNFFFNLRYDSQAILKYLPVSVLDLLHQVNSVEYGAYDIRLVEKKFFSISKEHRTVRFFDISQFYRKSLKVCAPLVGMKKLEFDVTELTEKDFGNPKMLTYCIEDSRIAQKLAERFVNLTSSVCPTKDFYSCASVSKKWLLTNFDVKFPRHTKLLDFALKSYRGGRFETMQRGYFDKLYNYDIRSAYPTEIAELEDCNGSVISDAEYHPDAAHSFLKCDVEIYNSLISPLGAKQKTLMIYPNGVFKDIYLTKREYELIDKLGFPIKVKEGMHLIGSSGKPFHDEIHRIFNLRNEYKQNGDDREYILKIILNSTYGCFIQLTKTKEVSSEETDNYSRIGNEIVFFKNKFKAGTLFNPIWAAEITANVRCKLFEDSFRKANNIIAYATDGILTTSELPLDIGYKLGEYEKCADSGIVLGCGIYALQEKQRMRGFSQNKCDLFELIKNNLDSNTINVNQFRPRNLGECIKQNRVGDLNKFEQVNKQLNINFDTKRVWERPFTNCRDVMNSQIMSVPLCI